MVVYLLWLLSVILWNFGFPDAKKNHLKQDTLPIYTTFLKNGTTNNVL